MLCVSQFVQECSCSPALQELRMKTSHKMCLWDEGVCTCKPQAHKSFRLFFAYVMTWLCGTISKVKPYAETNWWHGGINSEDCLSGNMKVKSQTAAEALTGFYGNSVDLVCIFHWWRRRDHQGITIRTPLWSWECWLDLQRPSWRMRLGLWGFVDHRCSTAVLCFRGRIPDVSAIHLPLLTLAFGSL